jgi:general secretion pathway protein G
MPMAMAKSVREAGFTLLELIVVIAIMGILWGIALPNYRNSVIQAKEAVLRENLYRLRDTIDHYHADKGKYPESLQALVDAGYLRELPRDPITTSTEWTQVPAEAEADDPLSTQVGIYDIKSTSETVGLNGKPYNEW